MDNSNILNFRNNPEKDKLTSYSLSKRSTNNLLSLRKTKLNSEFASKRSLLILSPSSRKNNYKININSLNLPSNIQINIDNFFSNFNLDVLNAYLTSNSLLQEKYALYLFRNFITKNEDYISPIVNQMTNEFLKELIFLLVKYPQDIQVQYETNWLLINLSYDNSFENKFCYYSNNYTVLLEYMTIIKEDEILVENAVWLVRNIAATNLTIKKELLNRKLIDIFEMYYNKYKECKIILIRLLDAIWNLLGASIFTEYILLYKRIIPIINTTLSHLTEYKKLNTCIYLFSKLSTLPNLIEDIIKQKVHIKLFQIYYELQNFNRTFLLDMGRDKERQLKLYIIKTIGALLYGNAVQTQILIDDYVIDFLNCCLKENDLSILKNTIFALFNIASGSLGQVSELYRKNSVYYVLQIGKQIYEKMKLGDYISNEEALYVNEVFSEVCYFSSMTILSTLMTDLRNFLDYDNSIAVIFLLHAIDVFKERDQLITRCIDALYKIAVIEKANCDEETEEKYLNLLYKHGLKEKIQCLLLSSNDKIASVANKFNEDIFDDSI